VTEVLTSKMDELKNL